MSECDGLTCGTVVSTTAQDHSVTTNHTEEEPVPAAVRMHRQRQSSTTRTSRVDRDMGVRLAGDIHVRINQLPIQG